MREISNFFTTKSWAIFGRFSWYILSSTKYQTETNSTKTTKNKHKINLKMCARMLLLSLSFYLSVVCLSCEMIYVTFLSRQLLSYSFRSCIPAKINRCVPQSWPYSVVVVILWFNLCVCDHRQGFRFQQILYLCVHKFMMTNKSNADAAVAAHLLTCDDVGNLNLKIIQIKCFSIHFYLKRRNEIELLCLKWNWKQKSFTEVKM